MPEITIDASQVMATIYNFDHLIWKIIHKANPEKVMPDWYAEDGVSDKINELWELIK